MPFATQSAARPRYSEERPEEREQIAVRKCLEAERDGLIVTINSCGRERSCGS